MQPSFFARLVIALVAFFRIILDAALAQQVKQAMAGELPAPKPVEKLPEVPAKPAPAPAVDHTGPALHVLTLLQREGRFLDFLQEDVTTFSDQDVGAAARVVHEGCRKALQQYLKVEPLLTQEEGTPYTVEAGFDPVRIRLTGKVVGNPPFKGQLKHRGWRATQVQLPTPPKDVDHTVLAPAEVEL
ncbi:MAG: DUF2760 domain-containing protein [Myxococcota bacterium]